MWRIRMIDFDEEYQKYLKSDIDIVPTLNIEQDTLDGKVLYENGKRVSVPRRIARQFIKDGQAIVSTSEIKNLKQAITKENLLDENKIATLHRYMYLDLKFEISLLDPFDRTKVEGLFRTLIDKRSHKIVSLASFMHDSKLEEQLTLEEIELFETIRDSHKLFHERLE